MEKNNFSIGEVKQLDMVDYLETIGIRPAKIHNNDYWYLSPLRNEKAPSFKVNRKLNAWYDHGMGQGGNIIDFTILFNKCSVKEAFEKLKSLFPFHRQIHIQAQSKTADEKGKIMVLNARPISFLPLLKYLKKRAIPIDIANQYCKEIIFELYGKKHVAIGFQNNAGGYELRSDFFKGSSSPKDVTLLTQDSKKVSVFEGFFSFLSYAVLNQSKDQCLTNFLVLNSLSFFDKSRPIMEKHEAINLYLDRDDAGRKITEHALKISVNQYRDCSNLYQGFKDLNDLIVQNGIAHKQNFKISRMF